MQTHIFDPWEFHSPASEETLRFAFAGKSEVASVGEFLAGCPRESQNPWQLLSDPIPLDGFRRFDEIRIVLERIDCSPEPLSGLTIVAVLGDDWNDLELLIESDDRYFWFHWDTTA